MNEQYSTFFQMYAHQQRVELLMREAEHERLVREAIRGRKATRRVARGPSAAPSSSGSRRRAGDSGWRSTTAGLAQRLTGRRAKA
ncbi:hypothetical protein [Streptomyces sp. NBRC 109706]|uniref:hypothetical protein n=1 Tax=Streptomyces sp. NBRC 109706 TaxID=1550035 RepID=UPI0007832659|nr:hypothetical protein [Streptomyces sp. NBRC 109706]